MPAVPSAFEYVVVLLAGVTARTVPSRQRTVQHGGRPAARGSHVDSSFALLRWPRRALYSFPRNLAQSMLLLPWSLLTTRASHVLIHRRQALRQEGR